MVKTACILAAGMGIRLREVVSDMPKGFLKIDNKSLIEYSVEKLQSCGVERIVIVTGHLSEFYENYASAFDFIDVIQNEKYAKSGSMYSLWCARNLLNEDFFLLESDLMYEARALERLQFCEKENAILLSQFSNAGDEVYVSAEDGKIKNMSKNREILENVVGELVGISKISKGMFTKMVSQAQSKFDSTLKYDYEDCIVDTAKSYPVYYLKIDDLIWTEIDDLNHYERLQHVIYPNIKRIEDGKY